VISSVQRRTETLVSLKFAGVFPLHNFKLN
jgi:hypothetical protein